MRLIGDIHGNVSDYLAFTKDAEESVQVGDFGMGFIGDYNLSRCRGVQASGMHKFIRGNHDDPAACKTMKGWIEDGHYDPHYDIMYVGGAWSIDWAMRIPGRSWWEDEELSISQFYNISHEYERIKPRYMITHDCPHSVATKLFFGPGYDTSNQFRTRTSQGLEALLEMHAPDAWFFGHWHKHAEVTHNGTYFRCIDKNDWIDVKL